LGQRVVQVWQETHCQMELARKAESLSPSCSRRISRVGGMSIRSATGHPAVHLPHW